MDVRKSQKYIVGLSLAALLLLSACEQKDSGLDVSVKPPSSEQSEVVGGDSSHASSVDTSQAPPVVASSEADPGVQVPNIQSPVDYNGNGVDDYTDFVKGAQDDAQRHPRYNPDYVSENKGYPDPNNGVCTDVIWRAFREAGYSLRSMLNADIKKRRPDYTNIRNAPDPNIDFRRVKTLRPFFEKYAIVLENAMTDPNEWQPGDVIIFNPRDFHIGILSDKRNRDGYPLVIHNMGQAAREEDYLSRKNGEISGHYRFDASQIPESVLKAWVDGEDGQ